MIQMVKLLKKFQKSRRKVWNKELIMKEIIDFMEYGMEETNDKPIG